MRTVVLDYETYYDKDFSLRNMTPVEYILDPRFETILCAVKEVWPNVGSPTQIIDGANFDKWVTTAGLDQCCVISHNALFDMSILAWRYNVIPRLMIDTLGVSRALLSHRLKGLSLSRVAQFLQLGVKGSEVANVVGMTRDQIKAAGRWDSYSAYCANDTELCADIYDRLVRSGEFPTREIAVMDMVLRCAIQPKFFLDKKAIQEHLANVQKNKLELLASAMLCGAQNGKSDLMSNEKFAELLRGLNVEPPRKISKITGLWTYAFAKTDKDFIALEDHPDPAVQVLVAARTGHKSTLEESRSQRLLNIASLTWPGNTQGYMPVPLRYAGAHTGRLSGDWKLNMQNLPRGGALRRALIAPSGHKVITVDAAQIEARIVAWLCGQVDLLEAFRNKEDVYAKFATEIFGYPISKKTHPKERFMGKTAILGLGYQVGHEKFRNTIETQSQSQLGQKVEMTQHEALTIVNYYRNKFAKISGTWRQLQYNGLRALAGNGTGYEIGPCKFEPGGVVLPNGLRLHYHLLQAHYVENQGTQWVFYYGEERKLLYGGKLLENMVQALARIVTMDAALRIQKKFRLGMQVHDELVYVVEDHNVHKARELLHKEMCTPPSWAPDLPLEADVGEGQSYGEAK